MDDIIKGLAEKVKWDSADIGSTLKTAECAVNALWRKKLPLADFWEMAAERNLYAAALLEEKMRGRQLAEEEAREIRMRIMEQCAGRLAGTELSPDGEAQTAAAALLLQDSEMLGRVLGLAERRIQEMGQGEDAEEEEEEEEEEGKAGKAEKVRMKAATAFSQRMFALLRHAPDELEHLARLYRAFYELWPLHWNEGLAHGQGVEIPVRDALPETLRELILRALHNGHLRYVDQVLKVFISVRLFRLGYTGKRLMEEVFQVDDDNLFRGILFAEKMILQDAASPAEGIEQWSKALEEAKREDNEAWRRNKGWFEMYELSRRLTFCPERACETLSRAKPLEPYAVRYRKSNRVQQAAFEALFCAKDKAVLEYLDVLGENNMFRFQTDEEYYPYFEQNPVYSMSDAVRNLKSLGYSPEEMIRIYMNTHMRSCYSLRAYLREVFADGKGLEVRRGYASIEGYFRPYRMRGRVEQREGNYGFVLYNVCIGKPMGRDMGKAAGNTWLVPLSYGWRQPAGEEAPAEGEVRYCRLTQLNLNNYSLRAVPEQAPGPERKTDGFQLLGEALLGIIETGKLTKEENAHITYLPLPGTLDREQKVALCLLVARCMAALAHSPEQLKYFVNMMNRLGGGRLSPCRHQTVQKQGGWVFLAGQAEKNVRECWERMKAGGLSAQVLFFAYINSPFKYCIAFSELMDACYGEDSGSVDLEPLLSGYTRYVFSGTIRSVTPDRRPGRQGYFVSVQPDGLYRGAGGRWDRFLFRVPDGSGHYAEDMPCRFEIGTWQSEGRTFYLKNVERPDGRRNAQKWFLQSAMQRAASAAGPGGMNLEDLRAEPVAWTGREVGGLVIPMVNALRRAGNITVVNEYLEAVGTNNPWRFGEGPLPDEGEWPASAKSGGVREGYRQLMERLAGQNELHTVLRVYFNTAARSLLNLDDVLAICRESGKDLASLRLWTRNYPLALCCRDGRLCPVNFVAAAFTAQGEEEESLRRPGEKSLWRLEGYDGEEGLRLTRWES